MGNPYPYPVRKRIATIRHKRAKLAVMDVEPEEELFEGSKELTNQLL
jgi:hypothetical protein